MPGKQATLCSCGKVQPLRKEPLSAGPWAGDTQVEQSLIRWPRFMGPRSTSSPERRGLPRGWNSGPSLCPPPPEVPPPGSPSPASYWFLLCLRLHRGNWVGNWWSWAGHPHEWSLSGDAEDPERAATHPPCSQGPGNLHLVLNLGQSWLCCSEGDLASLWPPVNLPDAEFTA